jgi:hypothetical protein
MADVQDNSVNYKITTNFTIFVILPKFVSPLFFLLQRIKLIIIKEHTPGVFIDNSKYWPLQAMIILYASIGCSLGSLKLGALKNLLQAKYMSVKYIMSKKYSRQVLAS